MPRTADSDLYGLALDEFITERNKLVKELRSRGDRDEAQRVAALAKPTVAAWAVNQLVRTQKKETKELLAAGDAVRKAHSNALTGKGDAVALKEASQRLRDATDVLGELARGLLSSKGHELATATLDRVADTLRAAALDPDARAEVKDGCLVRELTVAGFGG